MLLYRGWPAFARRRHKERPLCSIREPDINLADLQPGAM
jgi:hypothetical protein